MTPPTQAQIEAAKTRLNQGRGTWGDHRTITAAAEVGEGMTEYEIALANAHYKRGQADTKAEIERLRAALTDMVEITKRNSSPEIILTAIRTCASHALKERP